MGPWALAALGIFLLVNESAPLRFVREHSGWIGPVIWSYMSVDTFVPFLRMLQNATGVHVGLYDPLSLHEGVLATGCGREVLGVVTRAVDAPYELVCRHKGRTNLIPWHGSEESYLGTYVGRGLKSHHATMVDVRYTSYLQACGTQWMPTRAIILEQNPFRAIWVFYERFFLEGNAARFNATHFFETATLAARDYVTTWASYDRFIKNFGRRQAFLVRRFQVDRGCRHVLRQTLAFLSNCEEDNAACFARLPFRVRKSTLHDMCASHVPPLENTTGMRADHVWTKPVVCRVWSVLGHIARRRGHVVPAKHNECKDRDEIMIRRARIAAKASPDSRTVILTTTSRPYVSVTLNWLVRLRSVGVNRRVAIVGALDWESHDALMHIGGPVFPLIPRYTSSKVRASDGSMRFDGVWIERGEVLLALVRAGFNVLLCDSDAILTKDALGILHEARRRHVMAGADVVASSGSFPETLRKRLGGYTAVMGFAYFFASQSTVTILRESQELNRDVGDDQLSFNTRLGLAHTAVRRQVHLPLLGKGGVAANLITVSVGHDGKQLKVLILPDEAVRRQCAGKGTEETAYLLAMHCLVDKDGSKKEDFLSSIGLWSLRPDWESIVARRSRGNVDARYFEDTLALLDSVAGNRTTTVPPG